MAQLIKLQDYISRYEIDMFRYPAQFIRLKHENWKKFNSMIEQQKTNILNQENESTNEKGRKKFFFKRSEQDQQVETWVYPELSDKEKKQLFLDGLLPFQLKWASSSIREKSFLDYYYKESATLRYFLQRFPDTFLIMFNPIFLLKKVPVEGEIILITPVEIMCISMLDFPEDVKIIARDDRTWMQEKDNVRTSFLSPMISLKRTDVIIRSVLDRYSIDFPVRKLVLSELNEIQYESESYQTRYIGKEEYPEWFQKTRTFKSPLKHTQLKAAEALLLHCQTTSVKRLEWDEDDFGVLMNFDES